MGTRTSPKWHRIQVAFSALPATMTAGDLEEIPEPAEMLEAVRDAIRRLRTWEGVLKAKAGDTRAPRESFACLWCGEQYARTRGDQRYCSTRCRVAAHRLRVTTRR